jgi:cell division protease FtsH
MGENPLLFELLNEMDGLSEDADVIFTLTTNRPDLLEPALTAPGPCGSGHRDTSAGCRRRLISLYGEGLDLRLKDIEGVVTRTNGTSASFIKELLSRATLLAAEEGGELMLADRHVGEALGVMLVAGGTLTMRLLGGLPLPPDASSSNWFEDVDDGPPGSIPG